MPQAQMAEYIGVVEFKIPLNNMLSDIITLDRNLLKNSPNDSTIKFTNISLALLCFGSDNNCVRLLS